MSTRLYSVHSWTTLYFHAAACYRKVKGARQDRLSRDPAWPAAKNTRLIVQSREPLDQCIPYAVYLSDRAPWPLRLRGPLPVAPIRTLMGQPRWPRLIKLSGIRRGIWALSPA